MLIRRIRKKSYVCVDTQEENHVRTPDSLMKLSMEVFIVWTSENMKIVKIVDTFAEKRCPPCFYLISLCSGSIFSSNLGGGGTFFPRMYLRFSLFSFFHRSRNGA